MAADKTSNDALIGQTIAIRYRIISRLGVGGMGVAYRAWDEQRGVPVVIKIPKNSFLEDPKFAERFHREIRLLQGLSHPHIVPILDVGEHDGLPYVVMRFLPGGSLSNRRLRDETGVPRPNPPGMLHLWLPAVAAALDFVHASGVVHRDVKPANIFFDAFWGAYLGDFGIAKIVDASDTFDREHTLTASQMLIGTQDYMAPEQFRPKAVLDGRVDEYALAVMVYELVSGSRPFIGKSAHLIVEVTTQPAPPLKSKQWRLPSSLVDAVHRGLAKKPAERFTTCSEFATAALADVSPVQDEPGVARLLCPQCSNVLKLSTAAAGQKGKCPKCQAQMKVAEDLGALWLLDEAKHQRRAAASDSDALSSGGSNATPVAFAPLSKTTWITDTFRRPLVIRGAMIAGGALATGLTLLLLGRGVSALGLLATKQPPPAVAVQAETKLQLAEKALLENPLNPTANEIVARHWCFEQGDWARGLPYLAKSGLVSVSSTARDEIAVYDSPSLDSGALVRIAQRWWKLAKQKAATNEDSAPALQKHAVELFTTYVSTVADAKDVAFVTKWLDGDNEFRLLVDNKRPEPHEEMNGTVAADPKDSFPGPESSGTNSPPPAVAATTPKSPEITDDLASRTPEQILAIPPLKNSIDIELKLIPRGAFRMGSGDGHENEKPIHRVDITRPFYLGVTEVTNAQWKAVMMGDAPSEWKEVDLPVEQVSRDDAVAFCEKLSALPAEKAAGRVYRLPTEAEWEYACRAGTVTRFSFGNDDLLLGGFAWFSGGAGGHTHSVGKKKPNPWGLCDMHGNVSEWCSDRYATYTANEVSDPTGPAKGGFWVARGGSWLENATSCRSASRFYLDQSYRGWVVGFRVALDVRASDLSDSSAAQTKASVNNSKDVVQEQGKTPSPAAGPPAIGSLLDGREQGQREQLVKTYGGGDATEAAVNRALDWLVRQQDKDGLWSLQGPYVDGATQENRLAATAMSLLALQGAGNTTQKGRYKGPVAAAWTTLLKKQIAAAEGGSDAERRKSGAGRFVISLQDPPPRQALYAHAQVTIALCELYGMTKDPAYEEPARQAVAYAVAAQGPNGGWRYEPGQEGDMSVTGWYMMALKSAQMAGLEVPERTLAGLRQFLENAAVEDGSRYGYRFDELSSVEGSSTSSTAQKKGTAGPVTTAVSAEGLLCRQYLGWPREHAALAAGVAFLVKDKPVDWEGNKDVYAWYYISQVTHHMGGAAWEKWNSRMREVLPATQVVKGNEIGSWDPALDKWGPWGGRLFTTCFCTYMLEVYYRHLPLYGD